MAAKVYVISLLLIAYFYVIINKGNWYLKHLRFAEFQRYRANGELQTSTAYYSYEEKSRLALKNQKTNQERILQSNEEFKTSVNYQAPFMYNDTKNIDQSAVCISSIFENPEEQVQIVFPEYQYPDCLTLLQEEIPSIQIDNDEIVITCEDTITSKILLNPLPDSVRLYMQNEIEEKFEILYTNNPQDQDVEWLFASCEDEFTNFFYKPKRNEEAYEQAKAKMNTMSVDTKPVVILWMVPDSFSRADFFRKLPKTIDVLNSINEQGEYAVFDFKIHNAIGNGSKENIMPILGGENFVNFEPVSQDLEFDLFGDQALWNILRNYGFISMIGSDLCDSRFPQSFGRRPKVDHVVRNFYWAAYTYLDFGYQKSETSQKWIGSRSAHSYVLSYAHDLTRLYPDVNQLMYIHLNTEHEETGQTAAALDNDLSEFLDAYLAEFSETFEIVTFLQADRGMSYGNWFNETQTQQEMKLPAFFLIASQNLLDKIPNSYATLWHNTGRLNSKLDTRDTILWLTQHLFHTDSIRPHKYVNLFQDVITDERKWEDAKIPSEFWSWYVQTEFDQDDIANYDDIILLDFEQLVRHMVINTIEYINDQVFSGNFGPPGSLWQRLTLSKIGKIYASNLNVVQEQIQFEFFVNEHPDARFEVLVMIKSAVMKNSEHIKYKIKPWLVLYNGFVQTARIIGIYRKDSYSDWCEEPARIIELPPELCICKALT